MGVFLAAGPSCTITELTRLIGFGRLSPGERGGEGSTAASVPGCRPLLYDHRVDTINWVRALVTW